MTVLKWLISTANDDWYLSKHTINVDKSCYAINVKEDPKYTFTNLR